MAERPKNDDIKERTSLLFDSDMKKELRKVAKSKGLTFSALVTAVLRKFLAGDLPNANPKNFSVLD